MTKGLRSISHRATIAPILNGRTAMVEIEAVNRETGEVLDSMGEVGQVVSWFDAAGREIQDGRDAVAAKAYVGYRWWSIDLRQFQTVSIH